MRTHRLVLLLALVAAATFATAKGLPATEAERTGELSSGAVPQGGTTAEHLNLTSSGCLTCHGTPEIVGRGDPGLYVSGATLEASAHDTLSCTSCHPKLTAVLHANPQAELARTAASCASCHREEATSLGGGSHAPGDEGKRKPTCVTCHGAHDVPQADSRAFATETAARCSACHTERGESFFDGNYHGKETDLGRYDTAVCSDCHGPHRVLPVADPQSTVNPANVLTTCRQCHEQAPDNFCDIVIHVSGAPLPDDGRLRAATLYMMLLLVGTFGFFGIHTVLSIRHEWRERRRGER